MSSESPSKRERKYWGFVRPMPASFLVALAKQAEDRGMQGLFAPQVYAPPFLPLATAAAVTERIQLASGIAIAATRSPFETAMAALDLDRISGGRFVLGARAAHRKLDPPWLQRIELYVRRQHEVCHLAQLGRLRRGELFDQVVLFSGERDRPPALHDAHPVEAIRLPAPKATRLVFNMLKPLKIKASACAGCGYLLWF